METVWLLLVAGGMAVAAANGRAEVAVNDALRSSVAAVETTLDFLGATCLWLGLMKIAERSGLAGALSRLVAPLLRLVMPSVPPRHPAFRAVAMSISANLLGLGSAATPFGLKAMQELKRLAEGAAGSRRRAGGQVDTTVATPAMCTFVAMTCAGLTLVPGAVVALRAQMGSADPSATVGPTILTGLAAWVTVLIADAAFRRLSGGD